MKRRQKFAIGYTRTSSSANVGDDKDSAPRQRQAVQTYADRAGYRIVGWFDDSAVKGADTIETRPGFIAALEKACFASSNIPCILSASRLTKASTLSRVKSRHLSAVEAVRLYKELSEVERAFAKPLACPPKLASNKLSAKKRGSMRFDF